VTIVLQIEDIQEALGNKLFKIVVPPGVEEVAFLLQFPSNSGQAVGQDSSVDALLVAAVLADEANRSGPPQPIHLVSMRDFSSTHSDDQSFPPQVLVRLHGIGLQMFKGLHECVVSLRHQRCNLAAQPALRLRVSGQPSQPPC
jgi:hypothetical protein